MNVKNHRAFFDTVRRCLSDDGLLLLQTIGSNSSNTFGDPWIEKCIFPGAVVPSVMQIGRAIEGLFIMEDWHNFGTNYDKTLMAWHENFVKYCETLEGKYDEKFCRMWSYYLLMSAGAFRARYNQLWQIVLSKSGVRGGYRSIRTTSDLQLNSENLVFKHLPYLKKRERDYV